MKRAEERQRKINFSLLSRDYRPKSKEIHKSVIHLTSQKGVTSLYHNWSPISSLSVCQFSKKKEKEGTKLYG
ncbi:hypothetical protein STEG23_017283 [Scotinomys teguina]